MSPTARRPQQAMTVKLKQLLCTHPFDAIAWEAAVGHDLHLRIGNAVPAIGKKAALAELSLFFARIDSLGAGFCEMCSLRETVFAEMEVGFTDATGREQRIPCVIVARIVSNSVLDLRFHLDPSPIP